MKLIEGLYVEVRHAPGFDDDGRTTIWNERRPPRAIPPEVGINGHVGTWTTIHQVYFDEQPVDKYPPSGV